MNRFSLFHLEDGALRRGLVAAVPAFHVSTASLIAHLAEFDARRLYAPEGYPSMCAFCVGELGLTREVAKKLIRVGRTARRFPQIFHALSDGRLNPSGVILLAPWLSEGNASELLRAASGLCNEEIRRLLADRVPQLDVPWSLTALPGTREGSVRTPDAGPAILSLAAEGSVRTPEDASSPSGGSGGCDRGSVRTPERAELAGGTGEPGREVSVGTPDTDPRLNPLGMGRYEARFTMTEATRTALEHYERLLAHKADSAAIDAALRCGLEALARDIEKRRYAATDRPRAQQPNAPRGRHIPAAVKRAVRARDGDRCTFVSRSGRRCEACGKLEFDHIVPVARGGASTLDNLRLRCRAHNQYEAERAFGAGFMQEKREAVRRPHETPSSGEAPEAQEATEAPGATEASGMPEATGAPEATERREWSGCAPMSAARHPSRAASDPDLDVTPWLMRLGFRKQEARAAAARCADMTEASLEARVRSALGFLAPQARVDRTGRAARP